MRGGKVARTCVCDYLRPHYHNHYHQKKKMLPQKPAHVSQELWELELPSILGLAHPRISDDGTDSDDFSPLGADVFTQPIQAPAVASASTSASAADSAAASSSLPTTHNPTTHHSGSTTAVSEPELIFDVEADIADSAAQSMLDTQVYEAPGITGFRHEGKHDIVMLGLQSLYLCWYQAG